MPRCGLSRPSTAAAAAAGGLSAATTLLLAVAVAAGSSSNAVRRVRLLLRYSRTLLYVLLRHKPQTTTSSYEPHLLGNSTSARYSIPIEEKLQRLITLTILYHFRLRVLIFACDTAFV